MVFIVAGTAAATDGDEETPVSYESTLWVQYVMRVLQMFFIHNGFNQND